MMVVPRVVERLYAKISSKGEALKGWRKSIFDWAVRLGMRYRPYENSLGYRIKLAVARRLVFDKWRAALGGDLRIMISGSASLDARLCRLFCAAGIVLNEGYGLTETSPIVSTNVYPNRGLRIGSIGRPLENLDVRIGEDGEILVKGPSVMLGYYKEPELTAEAFDPQGYLRTGDIGRIEDGFLYITDRKKELFKTSGGKYITPQPIENALMQSRYIDQAMVVGNGKEHPSVILEPDFGELALWCEQRGIPTGDRAAMISDEQGAGAVQGFGARGEQGLEQLGTAPAFPPGSRPMDHRRRGTDPYLEDKTPPADRKIRRADRRYLPGRPPGKQTTGMIPLYKVSALPRKRTTCWTSD